MSEFEDAKLKSELVGLFTYLQRVRSEIASINRPVESDHYFESMADQLDAIVGATEEATESIMNTVDANEELLAKVRESVSDKDALALLDKVTENNMGIFEFCSFQDITGQRVSKVLKSIRYVEDRVNSLIEIWGKDELDKVEVGESGKSADEKLLNGPQLENKGISQDEIDKLFD